MFKAFKYRIYPNREQRNLINHHIGCCRYIYNYSLNLKNPKTFNEKIQWTKFSEEV